MTLRRVISGILLLVLLSGFTILNVNGETKKKTEKNTEKQTEMDYSLFASKLDKIAYDGNDLGAVWSKSSTTFKVWSPTASEVKVRLYEYGSDKESKDGFYKEQSMSFDKSNGIWSVTIKGNLKNKYYTYLVQNGKKSYEVVDIYAKAVGANGKRGMIVDLSATNPKDWDKDTYKTVQNQTDAMVWEVHVKDFSYSESSGVSKNNRGKFLAFTEKGTVVDGISGNSPTCVDYLKKLGVNYVQINPFYDFGSVDETGKDDQFNWGYDPVNYNVPEGSYSTNPYDGNVRIKECKEMIKALHNAGIGVIMDVVYNHTYTGEDSYFNRTVPNYYYRMNSDGTFSNGSGCGNDTASEHKMFRKFMIDSVTYWAKEYHIDGFRFDLMGLHDCETMNQIRSSLDEINPKLIMYGEAWNMPTACDEGTLMANQDNMNQLDTRIGAFDDTIRDALKGNTFDSTEKGFLAKGSNVGTLKTGIEGQCNFGWALEPTQTVTYSSCHDNYTLYDKLVSSIHSDDKKYRERYADLVEMTKLNSVAIFASQGMPFVLAGEEFCRSKDGDENSFKSPVTENMIDWNSVDKFGDVVEYYKGMIQIRNKINAFRDSTSNTAKSINYIDDDLDGAVAFTVKGLEKDNFKNIAVILNGNPDKSVKVDLGKENLTDKWVLIANNETAGLRNLGTVTSTIEVPKSSGAVLVDAESFNKNCKSDKGAVVVNYIDKETEEKVMTEIVEGKIGDDFDIAPSNTMLRSYKILDKEDTKGSFDQENQYATFYVEKYEGTVTSITFRYIDSSTDKEIAPSKVLTNHVGQQYFTPEIPTVAGYTLDTDALPDNGAGLFAIENQVVTYKFTKNKPKTCQVNVIYMDSDGNIMDIETLEGKKGEEYSAKEKEYENLTLSSMPDNAKGKFRRAQQNVLYSYQLDSNKTKVVVVTTILVLLAMAAGTGITLKSRSSIKKKRQKGIEIRK